LTQKDASSLFGGGANAFSKYERGDVIQSDAMDRLMRLVKQHPGLLGDLRGLTVSGVGAVPGEEASTHSHGKRS